MYVKNVDAFEYFFSPECASKLVLVWKNELKDQNGNKAVKRSQLFSLGIFIRTNKWQRYLVIIINEIYICIGEIQLDG